MAKINYYLRDKNAQSPTPILLYIHYKNVRFKFPTNETIDPKFWDSEKQEAKRTKNFPTNPEFNLRLRNIKTLAEDLLREYQNDNDQKSPTPEQFNQIIKSKLNPTTEPKVEKLDLITFCHGYLNECETRLNDKSGKPISKTTIRVYKQAIRELEAYQAKYYKNRTFDFEQIDYYFYTQFQKYLISEKNYSTNTVGKHTKTLKSFFLEAQARGLMPNFVSRKFKTVSEETDSIYLDVEELNTLFKLDLSNNPRLERVRDLFIVGTWSGLRFSDFTRIEAENIKDGFIEIQTQKTGETVVIPIHSHVEAIMSRYEGKTPNSLPKPMSNQKMNDYLKELGELAGIGETVNQTFTKGGKKVTVNYPKYELITTHTARRSFATNQYLAGFPSLSIMKLTGHRTEKAFMKYIKVTPKEHAQKLMELWNNQNKNLKIA